MRADTQPVFQKSPAWQVALATIVPLVVLGYAGQSTMVIDERYGDGAAHFGLVGWCVVLLGFAAWLNHVLFHRLSSVLPFLAAIVTTLLIWLWQKLAFAALIPNGDLKYGYFLNPGGAKARFWVLSCPLWVGLACLSICFILALVLGWRAGARFSLACLIPWWVAALLVFALPSIYLDGQGNASIVI
jgi:hypothetical protein